MNSAALTAFGFGAWKPLNLSAEKALLSTLPSRPGVYAIRCCNPLRRIGPSDIVYFGKAENGKGLKMRVRQYFHPGYGNATSLRIKFEIEQCCDFELAWLEQDAGKAKQLEGQLIALYEQVFGVLPPWNKRR